MDQKSSKEKAKMASSSEALSKNVLVQNTSNKMVEVPTTGSLPTLIFLISREVLINRDSGKIYLSGWLEKCFWEQRKS